MLGGSTRLGAAGGTVCGAGLSCAAATAAVASANANTSATIERCFVTDVLLVRPVRADRWRVGKSRWFQRARDPSPAVRWSLQWARRRGAAAPRLHGNRRTQPGFGIRDSGFAVQRSRFVVRESPG